MSGRAPGIPSSHEASRLQSQAVDWRPLQPHPLTMYLRGSDHQSEPVGPAEPVSMNTVWCSTAKTSPAPTNSTDSSASAPSPKTWSPAGRCTAKAGRFDVSGSSYTRCRPCWTSPNNPSPTQTRRSKSPREVRCVGHRVLRMRWRYAKQIARCVLTA
jgi:hypothetical protein